MSAEHELLTWTDAPPDYDGFGTRTVNAEAGTVLVGSNAGKPVRLVQTPREHLEWQRARYGSGNYMSMSRDDAYRMSAGTSPAVRLQKWCVRKVNDPESWIIRSPGGRLNHWTRAAAERAEFLTQYEAYAALREERAERFAHVVPV